MALGEEHRFLHHDQVATADAICTGITHGKQQHAMRQSINLVSVGQKLQPRQSTPDSQRVILARRQISASKGQAVSWTQLALRIIRSFR